MTTPDKRTRILEAAARQYEEHGFTGARIGDIAIAAGVGKGTVYEYFQSKEELLLDACLHVLQANEGAMGEIIGSPTDTDFTVLTEQGLHPVKAAHQVLDAVLQVLLTRSVHEQRLFSELFNIVQSQPAFAARARAEFHKKLAGWRDKAHRLYEMCLAAGHFRPLPAAEDAAHLIVAAVDGLIWQRFWEDDIDPAERARRIADVWCRLQMHQPERLEDYLA